MSGCVIHCHLRLAESRHLPRNELTHSWIQARLLHRYTWYEDESLHSPRRTIVGGIRESLFLRSHWVMVVMDQCTRRIVGFAVHAGDLDGPSICCMLNRIIAAVVNLPTALSTDHDPLFEFHRWKANLRILEIAEISRCPWYPFPTHSLSV